jgi:cytochrome o ubiquinol oxidase operon protein cyoD
MNTAQLHQSDYGLKQKTLGIYTFGTLLCIILTIIPFAMVKYEIGTMFYRLSGIFTAAILQLIVQVVCFLRLNYSTEQARMNVMSFIFTIVTLAVIVGGSLWIMWSLDYRMVH